MPQPSNILIDTNVILRLLVNDIPAQHQKSKRIFKNIEQAAATGWISILVVNEIIWIMEHFYEKKREDYFPSLLPLFTLQGIKIVEIDKKALLFILSSLQHTKQDFTDAYLMHAASSQKIPIASFDKDFDKKESIKRIETLESK